MISRRTILAGAASAAAAAPAWAADRAIDENGFVTIGGIEQWISLRGADRRNPILFFLHGGPGEAQSPFLSLYKTWERDYTVVHWDQRGAGKTYGRNPGATPDLTVERMADDVAEIADHLHHRLGRRKIVLVGQSWGTFLGTHAVKRRAAPFAAFVGTGQIASWSDCVEGHYAFAKSRAEAEKNEAALKELAAVAPLNPNDFAQTGVIRKWLNYYLPATDKAYFTVQHAAFGDRPYPKTGDVGDWMAGSGSSIPKLLPTVIATPMSALGYDMPLPFFVIQGRDDHITPTAAAKAYFDKVTAPKKGYAEIDGGHFAAMINPEGFLAALNQFVQPVLSQ